MKYYLRDILLTKARRKGFPEFWTIISKQDVSLEVLRAESPTMNLWFVSLLRSSDVLPNSRLNQGVSFHTTLGNGRKLPVAVAT